jgi:TonB family protein
MRNIARLWLSCVIACACSHGRVSSEMPLADTTIYSAAMVDVQATVKHCPSPWHDRSVLYAWMQGRVMVQLVIDAAGRAESTTVKVLESPNDSLSSAAVRATLACKFNSARLRGRAVQVRMMMPFDFVVGP